MMNKITLHCALIIGLVLLAEAQNEINFNQALENGVNKHNFYRRQHQVNDLILDWDISKISQRHAEKLAASDSLFPSGNKAFGENLSQFCATKDELNVKQSIVKATNMWYKGVSSYDFSNPIFSFDAGSFTQLVWSSSESVGFGLALGNSGNMKCAYIVANYYPPGNVQGSFDKNVFSHV